MQTNENTIALEIIEEAGRDQPYCTVCGQHTRPVARDGVIWLDCLTWAERKSRLARIISVAAGHTRRMLVDDPTPMPG